MMMKKQNIAIIVIVALLLINLGTMAFFWLRPQQRGGERADRRERQRTEVADFMRKELNLTEEQQQAFQELRASFFEKSKDLRRDIRSTRREFYKDITSQNEAQAVQKAEQIAARQKELEMNTFYHFQELRSELNEQQQVRFDELMGEMLNARWMDNPGRRRGRQGSRDR